LAHRLRASGLTIEDAFCFLSSLYFRGKVAYARRFGSEQSGHADAPEAWVIAPGFGLLPPHEPVDLDRLRRLRRVRVDPKSRSYRTPLHECASRIAERLAPDGRAILLGSLATGKYIDVLRPIFGDRLAAPRAFIGVGDMSRGGLMLQAVRSGIELDYVVVEKPISGRPT
jgi:hypothetical protein